MEAMLHFLLSRLRGSLQAKKARSNSNKLTVLQTTSAPLEGCKSLLQDFKGLWPIKDTRQQRDYRKVVHTLLSDMEHAGKLPRRLLAALQSMFTMAAGSRQETAKD
ncbi:hypothetical protein ABBQ32_008276 [Trebouxia sp. C0010 RCD-2024]